MPTGYTADVGEGKVTSLRTFILRCARGFGALIHMRDEAMDAPLPDEIKPDTKYYDSSIERAREGLSKLANASRVELQKMYDDEQLAAQESDKKYAQEKALTRSRYNQMLEEVNSWTAPSADHAGLKKFMKEQLEKSIEFDCSEYKTSINVDFEQWLHNKLKVLAKDVGYYEQKRVEEIARTNERNKWLQDLLKSLPEE